MPHASGEAPREGVEDLVDKIDSLVAQLTESHSTIDSLNEKITEFETSLRRVSKSQDQLAIQQNEANIKIVAMRKRLRVRQKHVRRLKRRILLVRDACADSDLFSEVEDLAPSDADDDDDDVLRSGSDVSVGDSEGVQGFVADGHPPENTGEVKVEADKLGVSPGVSGDNLLYSD